MNNSIKRMLERYDLRGFAGAELALREILQEIALVGLWRAKFFEHAAFYGGTALRILYGLDRFSEDLDFTLLTSSENFSWNPYTKTIIEELEAFGFTATMDEKKKQIISPIRSAFLKANTLHSLLQIGLKGEHRDSQVRIKVEIDTEPTFVYEVEQKFIQDPIPIAIKSVKETHLFVGKTHAAFFRGWKGRVKGRDWYDWVWFIRRGVSLDLTLFSQMMGVKPMNQKQFLELAKSRIEALDVKSAIQDIVNFVKDREAVEKSWSKDFFLHWLNQLTFNNG